MWMGRGKGRHDFLSFSLYSSWVQHGHLMLLCSA